MIINTMGELTLYNFIIYSNNPSNKYYFNDFSYRFDIIVAFPMEGFYNKEELDILESFL